MRFSFTAFTSLFLLTNLCHAAKVKRRASKGQAGSRRNLKSNYYGIGSVGGKGKGGVLKDHVKVYEDPPAGLSPGDWISGDSGASEDCVVYLEDDLDCTADIDCLTLDAQDADVTLDCKGNTIFGSGFGTGVGIFLDGNNDNTITIKNCIVSGFETCIESVSGDYNVVLEETVATGCQVDGILL